MLRLLVLSMLHLPQFRRAIREMSKETIDRLKEVPLFSGLSEKQLSDILKVAGKRVFEAGTPIVRQGKETNAAFFLILDGQVEVKRGDRTLSKLDSGQFFGEMALFGDQPRSADVIPMTDTTCLVIARWNLEELFKTSPDIPMRMLAVLSQRLHDTDKQLTE